jgi:uncharacterized protein YyaL (SSP411 family)
MDPSKLLAAARALLGTFDEQWGGFGQAPKFPQPMSLSFLQSIRLTAACDSDPQLAALLDQCLGRSLTAMARGGIFDQIGGGFSRYSVDQQWLIPHFEKMLYDNALLVELYATAWQRFHQPMFEAIVEETVQWLQRELLLETPEGLVFAASLDADTEGQEGLTYAWAPEQVAEVLGKDAAAAFCKAYFITDKGNFEAGTSVPALTLGNFEARAAMAPQRAALLEARQRRPQPGRAETILTAWNALAVRALATAALSFNRPDWLQLATQVYQALRQMMFLNGRLYAVNYAGQQARHLAGLADLGFMAEAALKLAGCVDWLEPGTHESYLRDAELFIDLVDKHHQDSEAPGYFMTPDDGQSPALRKKDWLESALPSGLSSVFTALTQLDVLRPEGGYGARAQPLAHVYADLAQRAPSGVAWALTAWTQQATGLAVVKAGEGASLEALRSELAKRPWRQCALLRATEPALSGQYQLCVGQQCLPPSADPKAIADKLSN